MRACVSSSAFSSSTCAGPSKAQLEAAKAGDKRAGVVEEDAAELDEEGDQSEGCDILEDGSEQDEEGDGSDVAELEEAPFAFKKSETAARLSSHHYDDDDDDDNDDDQLQAKAGMASPGVHLCMSWHVPVLAQPAGETLRPVHGLSMVQRSITCQQVYSHVHAVLLMPRCCLCAYARQGQEAGAVRGRGRAQRHARPFLLLGGAAVR